MFVSESHLPQLLEPAHYTDPAFAQLELARLFLPGWHCIGLLDQFRRDGDFCTTALFGRPLISWRIDGVVRTFLNVCAHRFCVLTDRPTGHFPRRITCQYHGWEYDESGNTCRIPDAQHFRPLKKGELGLREYRTETVGQLIFVTLDDRAPGLAEFLSPELVRFCRSHFSPEHRLTQVAEQAVRCNWKVVVENLLEAYHIETVHPRSFKRSPAPEHCSHEFHPTHDHYVHDYSAESHATWERRLLRLTGQTPECRWHHILRYPNVALGGAGPCHYVQMIYPTGPDTCRLLWLAMHYSGPRGRVWPFLMHRLIYRGARHFLKQVQREDARIYPSIHRGTAAPDRPHGGGLLSAREERIFAFQEHVLRETGQPLPPRAATSVNPAHVPVAPTSPAARPIASTP
jgi:phenylpropionate dioxygenase-like ring-hydroxylating dioxygenase large terminal subunit